MRIEGVDFLEERVLVVAPRGRDAALVERLLAEEGISCEICPNLAALAIEMHNGAGVALLTEEALDSSTEELEEALAAQLPWSNLPVLLFPAGTSTREAVSPRVRRLNDLAAVTLLDRPIRRVSLASAVRAALRTRGQQYEVRDLLARLEMDVRSRDEFLAILGHELRNPLGAILTAVQLMERSRGSSERERSIILRQTRLLSRLVDDLLDVSRVASGKVTLQRAMLDVRDVVERCVAAESAAAAARRIALACDSGERPWWLEGDPVRLEQVVNNLLTNAVKYTPPGGRVDVTVTTEDGTGEIRVSDSGVGMDPQVIPRIFDLFAQADKTLDRSQGGLGIGLTLVRRLVEMHGGTVRASSPGPGKGSTFVIRLPRLPEGARDEAGPPAWEAAEGEPGESRRILVVEDNEDLREGLASLLRNLGHDVVAAENGEEGIEKAMEERPEVALVDIGLPLLDGYAVAKRIREVFGARVFLVALTGYGLADDRRRALDAGFDEHLTKPATAGAIVTLLRKAG